MRWATPDDFRAVYGDVAIPTCRAVAAVRGGAAVAIMGWRPSRGGVYVFSKALDGLKSARLAVWRAALDAMARLSGPAWCVADPQEPGAAAFLTRLGWVSTGWCDQGEVFEWRKP